MSLCTDPDSTFTDDQLDEQFTKANVLPVIPAGGFTGQARTTDDYGLLTSQSLSSIVQNMKSTKTSTKKIPVIPDDFTYNKPDTSQDQLRITRYITDTEQMKVDIKDEYCFYNARYRFAMRSLITQIANATAGNSTNVDRIQKLTQKAISLNQKLTDLTQIVNAITNMIYQDSQGLGSTINDLNTQISGYYTRLQEQASILQSEAPAAELKKRMVEFTREKAMASNNMLSFYFFMDVVALGILFYVYRAS